METFSAKIYIIGVNPYVLLPPAVLKKIFADAKKDKGAIQVCGTLNGKKFIQSLVKYKGKWRFYLNTPMRKAARIDVGDVAHVNIKFDPKERLTPLHPKLKSALQKNKTAKKVFDALSPSRQKEIKRYINNLRSEDTVVKNVERAIRFLNGKERFVGKDKP